jgi:hypothetical protein
MGKIYFPCAQAQSKNKKPLPIYSKTDTRLLLTVIVSILLVVGFISCNSTGEIKGEVFVVTKGAQNIKLALVEVSAIPEKDIKEFVDKKSTLVETERKKLEGKYDSANKEYQIALKQYQEADQLETDAEQKYQEASKKVLEAITSGDDSAEETARRDREYWHSQRLKYISSGEKFTKQYKETAWKEARVNLDAWPTPEFIFKDFPVDKAIAKATTDSDGRFTLKIPAKGKFALIAHSNRQILSMTEEYHWFTWVTLDGSDTKNIMLSNTNLINIEHPEMIIKAGVQPVSVEK